MKKTLLIIVLLLSMITVVCGCKDSDEEGEKSIPEGAVYTGGTVTVGITQDLDGLDPHKITGAGTREILYNIFEGLVKSDENGNLVPAVASKYSISDDNMKYTFELRKNVKFHNGKTVTADDVIYSLKRCAGMLETQDPEVQVVSALSCISEINETEDGVEIILSEPDSELIGYLTCGIIPEDYDGQSVSPVGTGPFRFVSYTPLQNIIMEKNTDYYVSGVPYIDKAVFKVMASADAAFLELMAGGIDIFPYLTVEQSAQLDSRLNVLSSTMNLVQALFLNNAVEPFDDIRVRQAICHAIDRQQILDMVSAGRGEIIGSGMFPSFTKYYNSDVVDAYPYDTEKAKKLLADAGYPDGFSFTISVPSNYTFHVNTAQVIVEQLKQVGIMAEIKLVEWATWTSEVYAGRKFEATVVGLDSQLAPSDVFRFYPSDSRRNFINYISSEFDELFSRARSTNDAKVKEDSYKQLQKLLSDDAASAFIQSPIQLVAVNRELSGYTFYPIFVQDMSKVYYTTSGEGRERAD